MAEPEQIAPLETTRLRLRDWRAEDLEPFRTMNADAQVMQFFPRLLDSAASDALALRCQQALEQQGFGFWALELKAPQAFIGFLGLSRPNWPAPFMPCTEIGWRLAAPYWGQGYATEAGLAVLQHGFSLLKLAEIVSFTARLNLRSQRVMQRLGMHYQPHEDFNHPLVPTDSPLAPHVLYRLNADRWRQPAR